MINTSYVVVIDDTDEIIDISKALFKKDKSISFIHTVSKKDKMKEALKIVPDLIIISADSVKPDIFSVCDFIRKEKDNAIIPVIVVGENKDRNYRISILEKGVEYYIRKPLHEGYLYYTIKNISKLISANRCISALTGLPGNIQIESELKRRIASKKPYAVLYTDLDNFKAYNDKYGYKQQYTEV